MASVSTFSRLRSPRGCRRSLGVLGLDLSAPLRRFMSRTWAVPTTQASLPSTRACALRVLVRRRKVGSFRVPLIFTCPRGFFTKTRRRTSHLTLTRGCKWQDQHNDAARRNLELRFDGRNCAPLPAQDTRIVVLRRGSAARRIAAAASHNRYFQARAIPLSPSAPHQYRT